LKALHHIVRRAMSKTVSSWQKVTASNTRLRIRLSRIIDQQWIRTVSRGIEAWYARARIDRQMKATALRVLQRLRRRELVEGFELWRDSLVAEKLAKQQLEEAARERQSMAEAEAERRIEMCKRVVQRMLRHQLLMAWNLFVDTVRETQHNRETVRKVLSRMQHRQLAGAFDCYAGSGRDAGGASEDVGKDDGGLEDPTAEEGVGGMDRVPEEHGRRARAGGGGACQAAAGGLRSLAGHMAATKTVPLQSLESTASHRASGNVEDGELLAESDSLQQTTSHQTIPHPCSTLEEDSEPWDRGLVRASPDGQADEGHGTQGGAGADAPVAGGGLRALAYPWSLSGCV
jgi:hypothetical protein